jgi:hypothetical protein
MTAHSPVGLAPADFKVMRTLEGEGSFANNDLPHRDPQGADHEAFGFGLAKSLLNYMHGACFDYPLHKWFDFKVPSTKIAPTHIQQILEEDEYLAPAAGSKVVWLGGKPSIRHYTKSKKGQQWDMSELVFEHLQETFTLHVGQTQGDWLAGILDTLSIHHPRTASLQEIKESYERAGLDDFELFWDNKPVTGLRRLGLLRI